MFSYHVIPKILGSLSLEGMVAYMKAKRQNMYYVILSHGHLRVHVIVGFIELDWSSVPILKLLTPSPQFV